MVRPADTSHSWMRAACAVHEQERQLRRFIEEMYRATEALVVRMQLLGYGKARDRILGRALALRDRLAAEASRPPLLHAWRARFDALVHEETDIDAPTDEALARDVESWGPPEAASHQLPLRFAG